ncbi:LAO/AO transport system kinase [Phascolarctobacterium faecium DSM 14760]|uniref:methylmalonyl Co-A mutase-associated GTPase MeaB n=1 Tax=Phascolarctobacterium faecium TaxID=33025 RepID=UPI000DC4D602|nr:methylmalonyl Co-A mutase-associated GTPase MeaB [Phascolarctobacterium faecium]RAS53783.1 LAO/AO transport system kinase [Phascolarctobacterium faecium DSM 14760]
MNIVEGVLNHSRLALAKAITAVENEYDNAVEIMTAIYPHTGNAYVIGITGPPGAGKSTLTDKLAKEYRKRGKTVGIIAIDPTSPFSGGAILGDRIRMLDLTADEGIFVRSMATRGSLGGLSQKAGDAVKLMDAYGFDVIIVETVGVGQSEVDIVKTADTTMVVVIPGMGDDIQAIKAGILEIGDLFTINKADREGTDKLNIEIEMMLELNPEHFGWRPPINRTIASKGEGIEAVVDSIEEHKAYLIESDQLSKIRKARIKNEVTAMLNDRVNRYIDKNVVATSEFDILVEKLQIREIEPYSVVADIVGKVLR